MNNIVKNVLIFGSGAGLGFCAAMIALKKTYANLADEEIASVKENMAKRNAVFHGGADFDGDETIKITTKPEEKKEDKVLVMTRDRYKKIARRYGPVVEKQDNDLDEFEPIKDEEEDYIEGEKLTEEENEFKSDKKPYIISDEEFSEGEENFDKITIYYYEDDETLTDENEEIIADIEGTIGKDNLNEFDTYSDDPYTFYVRNERYNIDYEVIVLQKSYSKDVLGFEDGNNKNRGVKKHDYTND
jgi:hypothetical protein